MDNLVLVATVLESIQSDLLGNTKTFSSYSCSTCAAVTLGVDYRQLDDACYPTDVHSRYLLKSYSFQDLFDREF